jgi:hypothetical protein
MKTIRSKYVFFIRLDIQCANLRIAEAVGNYSGSLWYEQQYKVYEQQPKQPQAVSPAHFKDVCQLVLIASADRQFAVADPHDTRPVSRTCWQLTTYDWWTRTK